jgi:hypothetical protein
MTRLGEIVYLAAFADERVFVTGEAEVGFSENDPKLEDLTAAPESATV